MSQLHELMLKHGTDKCTAHQYQDEYERHFAPLKDKPIRLLEIGIGGYMDPAGGGCSLRAWADYFWRGEIHGLDVHSKVGLKMPGNVTLWRGSQADVKVLERIHRQAGPFDIVIDDGSHYQSHVINTFDTLFPLMADGGIYVIEDLGTAYDPSYGGCASPLAGDTSFALIGRIIELLHLDSWPEMNKIRDNGSYKSIHVSPNIAFIYKK